MTIKTPLELAEQARQINDEHRKVIDAERTALQHAIAAGKLLNVAKSEVPRGRWLRWLQEYCPDISDRTANVYMLLANHEQMLLDSNPQRAADLSIRGALRLIREEEDKGSDDEPESDEDV